MRRLETYLLSAALLLGTGCTQTTDLPVQIETVAVSVSVDQLVCHVRAIAKEQRVSFHYGTFADQTGPKATIRLIAETHELAMARWDRRPQYEIRAYDSTKDKSAPNAAKRSLQRFKTALIARLKAPCSE